jgi:hypothetical protein
VSSGPRIQCVGFAAGLRWLPAGAELMFSALGPMAGVASLWLLVSLIAMVIPVIGQIILVLFTPLLTAGVLAAFDAVRGGRRPLPTTLFAGWKDPVRRTTLLVIGSFSLAGSMLAAMILIGWVGNQLGQEQLEAALVSQEAMIQALSGVSIGGGFILAALVFSLVLAAIYFAIPLVMFDRWPTLPALLTSFKAVIYNWAGFLGFGLAFLVFAAALGLILVLVVSVFALALGAFGQFLGQVAFLVMTMFVQILMGGAQYVAFSQIFGWLPETDAPSGGSDDDDRVVL